jgi:hypothetical protein
MKINPRRTVSLETSGSRDAELADALERYLADLEAGNAPDL